MAWRDTFPAGGLESGYLRPGVESGWHGTLAPCSCQANAMDRALSASQPPASVHGQSDCPLLSWVVKDGYLATRKAGCKRASGANGMEESELEA